VVETGKVGTIATTGKAHRTNNFKGPSNDPYLAGVMGAESVRGLQDQGVISSVKVITPADIVEIPNQGLTSQLL
jgi:hypothetical protein